MLNRLFGKPKQEANVLTPLDMLNEKHLFYRCYTGAAAMKAVQKATNIDDVDKTMDEKSEQTENMKQIQEVLATPIGAAADFDEDELEAELEELEETESP